MKQAVFVSCVMVAMFSNTIPVAQAQAAGTADQKPTFASEYDRLLTGVEKQFVEAAEAMPEDKFNFAPTGTGDFKDVRTFGFQVKHVAVANYLFASGILQEKPPVDIKGPNGPDNVSSRADILKFLKDSFAYAHKALAAVNEQNVLEPIKAPYGSQQTTRLTLATRMLSHPYDHYGQMVEYLRMNSIIPPASRPAPKK